MHGQVKKSGRFHQTFLPTFSPDAAKTATFSHTCYRGLWVVDAHFINRCGIKAG